MPRRARRVVIRAAERKRAGRRLALTAVLILAGSWGALVASTLL